MRTIWKYECIIDDNFDIEMPSGAKILTFQEQYGKLCIWCLVNPDMPKESRKFRLAGTGHPIEEKDIEYIGTVRLAKDTLILHLFEVLK